MKSWKELAVVMAICAVVVAWNLKSTPEKDEETEIGGFTTPEYVPVDLTKELGPAKRDIVLVQMDQSSELTEWCQKEIAAATGAKVVKIFPYDEITAPMESYDDTRSQDDAEIIIDELSSQFKGSDQAVLAVTSKDLYTSAKPEWRYCFGTHGPNHTAVISSVRMGARFQKSLFPTKRAEDRFRKLLLRYVLEMAYEVPRNDDPKSLLYSRVLAPRDLSAMEYRI